jgi:hypothetical protein
VRQWAEEKNPVVQLMLPMVEILTLAKQGAGEVVREAGLQVMLLAMAQEMEALTGCRYQRFADRQAQRWSREHGFVVVDGQKVPIERRRLRSKDGSEVRLGTYELFPADAEFGRPRLVEDVTRADYAELPIGDAESCGCVRYREVRHQRTIHPGQPGQAQGADGATPRRAETACHGDRWNAVQRPTDDRSRGRGK